MNIKKCLFIISLIISLNLYAENQNPLSKLILKEASVMTIYNEDGSINQKTFYYEDNKLGIEDYFNDKKKLDVENFHLSSGHFHHKSFDKNGVILNSGNFNEEGYLIGNYVYYDEVGVKNYEINYDENIIIVSNRKGERDFFIDGYQLNKYLEKAIEEMENDIRESKKRNN